MLFVREAIKQRAAQLRVFHHNFDTRPAVLLLSTKSYWGRNWPIHVSTMCTNLGSFCSTSPSWYCPCFDFGSDALFGILLLKLFLRRRHFKSNFTRYVSKFNQNVWQGTSYKNFSSFPGTTKRWFQSQGNFSHILRMDFVLQNLNENFDRAILKMSQIEAQFFCSIWTPPEFLRKKKFQQNIFNRVGLASKPRFLSKGRASQFRQEPRVRDM